MKLFHFLFFAVCLIPALSYGNSRSAVRSANESWKTIAYPDAELFTHRETNFPQPLSALNSSKAYSQVDFDTVQSLFDETEANDLFNFVRDAQFLDDGIKETDFERRISWLYPDDGCFVRAAMMSRLLTEQGLSSPQRIFVFGDLTVETKNSIFGYVNWWYHTALITRVDDQLLVWDPALNPEAPIELSQWLSLQTKDLSSLQVAICDPGTYGPKDQCQNNEFLSRPGHLRSQKRFLRREWRRQRHLGNDPMALLNEFPPWRTPKTDEEQQQAPLPFPLL